MGSARSQGGRSGTCCWRGRVKRSKRSSPTATARPPWEDENAVADWILYGCRSALLAKMGLEMGPHGDIDSFLDPDPEPSAQELAVEAAKLGKPQELADLFERAARSSDFSLHPDHPQNLSPSALRLAAEFLNGKRNLKTGRMRGGQQRGRPKMSDSERAASTPIHNAANYHFPAVRAVLRDEYPHLSARDYHDRALYIVSRRFKLCPDALSNYLRRPRGGAHRI